MANHKWQDDTGFIQWLSDMKYIEKEAGKLKPILSNGLYLYMYEAYNQGKKPVAQTVSKLDPYDYPFELASFQGVF